MKTPIKPLKDILDSVRDIEGFPIGTDEDILALSDPPYYTACPNPYINDFIEEHGTPYDEDKDDYYREPFVGDVREGKNDPVYQMHAYHTKVPPKAIQKFISHYTNKNDIIFDGFCGTGTAGYAALKLDRKAIITDLSPVATFIAHNYNSVVDSYEFEKISKDFLQKVLDTCGWMYVTNHLHSNGEIFDAELEYIVWSDVFICPYCHNEYVFHDIAFDAKTGKVLKQYNCGSCEAELKKTSCERAVVNYFDSLLNKSIELSKQVPVLITYKFEGKRYSKKPDENDYNLINTINKESIPFPVPIEILPAGVNIGQPRKSHLFTHFHHFYTKRNLWTLAAIFDTLPKFPEKYKNILRFTFEQAVLGMSKIARYVPTHFSQVNQYLSGTLYVGSQIVETSLPYIINGKIKKLTRTLKEFENIKTENSIISTQSSIDLKNVPSSSVDFIFTDPPFGGNLMYSDLNYLWETWNKVKTNNSSEAIVNLIQHKGIKDYSELMTRSFKEFNRILKPNRWITVEFHSSKSSIWNTIQDSIMKAGFIVAQVTVLDKKHGSFKQITSSNAAKIDLIISAYKPKQSFNKKFLDLAGEGLEEEFIKMHLAHLKVEPSVERTEQMLYSKLLAFYVQRSYTIKYDSSSFFKMLRGNFIEEDSYWFNKDQLNNYREYKQKMRLEDIDEIKSGQMVLFIQDEKSAIIWLNSFLNEPKDFQEIHPAYTKIANIAGDTVPDIKELLNKNFILEGGRYRRPQSEEEKLSVTEKRERELQKEFDSLLLEAKASKKKIKECRKQAIIYGFEQCYKAGKFKDILAIAARLNQKIIENDSEITEFIEVAEFKVEGF